MGSAVFRMFADHEFIVCPYAQARQIVELATFGIDNQFAIKPKVGLAHIGQPRPAYPAVQRINIGVHSVAVRVPDCIGNASAQATQWLCAGLWLVGYPQSRPFTR